MSDGYRSIEIRSPWSHHSSTEVSARARASADHPDAVADRCYLSVAGSGFSLTLDLTPDQAREIASMLWNVAGLQEEANANRVAEAA